ncbi:MAG: HD domain-containing protein [Solobacterium sp.]|nr:HD domain-containing protein [Solobacterium sp.]
MSRLKELRKIVDKKLRAVEDEKKRNGAFVHLYGVSLAAVMIAEKRGMNSELAGMAAMLHDLHAYLSGSYDDHAHKGAELARTILNKAELTNDEETDIICSMIWHHDDKLTVDSPMDEVLKDADVVHHIFHDLSKPVKDKERPRFEALIREFGLQTDPDAH